MGGGLLDGITDNDGDENFVVRRRMMTLSTMMIV